VAALETQSISSDLTGRAADQVSELWKRWRLSFGIRAAADAIRPHVTWVVGEVPHTALLGPLADLATRSAPFDVAFDGIGTFEEEVCVVYLRVRPDEGLRALHAEVFHLCVGAGLQPWPNYDPASWIPHVTLAMRDIEAGQFPALVADARQVDWAAGSRLEELSLVHLGPVRGTRREHTYRHTWRMGG
jgi:2'-5' RNA ligase